VSHSDNGVRLAPAIANIWWTTKQFLQKKNIPMAHLVLFALVPRPRGNCDQSALLSFAITCWNSVVTVRSYKFILLCE
jgi:hypothetical protein